MNYSLPEEAVSMPLPSNDAFASGLPQPYDALHARAAEFIPAVRLVIDPLRLLTWGTDASFYRLVPKIAVVVESEPEVVRLLELCAELGTPLTFRAAGTSLSGQAISDSVLVLLGDNWRRSTPSADGATIALQPGVIGAAANRALARFGRKIGPDPASIDAAMIGGIAANNASWRARRPTARPTPTPRACSAGRRAMRAPRSSRTSSPPSSTRCACRRRCPGRTETAAVRPPIRAHSNRHVHAR